MRGWAPPRLRPELQIGALGHRFPVSVGIELLENGRNQFILGQGLENWLTVVGAHLQAKEDHKFGYLEEEIWPGHLPPSRVRSS